MFTDRHEIQVSSDVGKDNRLLGYTQILQVKGISCSVNFPQDCDFDEKANSFCNMATKLVSCNGPWEGGVIFDKLKFQRKTNKSSAEKKLLSAHIFETEESPQF